MIDLSFLLCVSVAVVVLLAPVMVWVYWDDLRLFRERRRSGVKR